MSTNHTTLPKTVVIECQGYGKDAKGNPLHAEGHTEIRLIHAQDRKQCKRCEVCQAMYTKIQQKARRGDVAVRDAARKAVARKKQAEGVMAEYKDRLDKTQLAELQRAIKEGAAAEATIAKA